MLFEVANPLRYHPVVKLGNEQLVTAVVALRKMDITVELDTETWIRTFELSRKEEISIYDAVYLSLAIQSDAYLVTADGRLREGLSENSQKRVLLLSTLKQS